MWWYLSFADGKFLGAVIIRGADLEHAIKEAWRLKLNPGGEVLGMPILEAGGLVPEEKYRLRLLTLADIKEFWPDAKSIKEFEDE